MIIIMINIIMKIIMNQLNKEFQVIIIMVLF